MKRVLALIIFLSSLPIQANQESRVDLFVGSFAQALTNVNSDHRILFTAGGDGKVYLSESWGINLGLKSQKRGFNLGGFTKSAVFADLYLAAIWNLQSGLWSDEARTEIMLGPIFLFPLGNYRGPLSLAFGSDSQTDIGFYLAMEQSWKWTEVYSLGYRLWFSQGFKGITTNAAAKIRPIELGASFVFTLEGA